MDLNVIVKELRDAKKVLQGTEDLVASVKLMDEMIDRVEEPLMVMVMGEFSTGKSTFINALVGEKVTAVAATPTTAVITKLCYGIRDTILVHFLNGEVKEYSSADFAKLTAQEGLKGADAIHANIDYVERKMPLAVLRDITVIDSPGMNAIVEGHQEATQHFIKNADTVLWMFSVDKALSKTEQRAMERLNSRLKPVAIINKMDQFDEEEEECTEEEFIRGIQNKLKDKVSAVIGMSAMLAMKGKKENNPALIQASNIAALQKVLEEKIIPNREVFKINSLADDLGSFVDSCMQQVAELDKANKEYETTNYSKYIDNKVITNAISDAVGRCMQSLAGFFNDNKLNYSAVYLKALDYYWGIISEKNLQKAEELLEKAAINNHLGAQSNLINLYWQEQLDDKAKYWVGRVVEQGGSAAIEALEFYYSWGKQFFEGTDRNKDVQKAIELFTKAAEAGHIASQELLADIYEKGRGVDKNMYQALIWYERLAEQGAVEQQLKVADIYYFAKGVSIDYKQAVKWYARAAKQGNIEAEYALGVCYEKGQGVEENRIQAKEHYEKALKGNKYKAALRLAQIYYDNVSVNPSDLDIAKQYIDIAVKYGLKDSRQLLGQIEGALEDREDERLIAETTDIAQMALLSDMFIDQRKYEKAFRVLSSVAEVGNDEAQYELAEMYDHGKGTKKNCKLAIKWYEKAAAQGNIEAKYRLAEMYCGDNDIVIVDFTKGIMLYEQLLKCYEGKVAYQAACQLAKIYLEHDDLDNAQRCAELAISKNEWTSNTENNRLLSEIKIKLKEREIKAKINAAVTPDAKFKTAVGFYHEENYEVAFNLFSQAAEANHIRATEWLAHMYLNGYGVKADKAKAFSFYQKGTEGNDAEAWNMLGRCYYEGWGCTQNLEEANRCFQKAAALDCVVAQFNLALNYFYGNGLIEDKAKALAWFKLAAGNGHNNALAWIGYCYLYGYSVGVNADKAQEFFQRASANGSKLPDEWKEEIDLALKAARATAAEEVYEVAQKFIGLKKYDQGIVLHERAAAAGYAESQYALGKLYFNTEKYRREGVKWYLRAAKNNHAAAQNMVGRCYTEGWEVAVNKNKAVEYYTAGAANGNAWAQYNLATCYEIGEGCKQDEDKAKLWYERAAQNGNENAQKRLKEIAAAASSGCLLPILVTIAVFALLIL